MLCFKAYFDRVEEKWATLPVPFAGGLEFAGRDAGAVSGADDLGSLVRTKLDVPDLLRQIEDTYTRMGKRKWRWPGLAA